MKKVKSKIKSNTELKQLSMDELESSKMMIAGAGVNRERNTEKVNRERNADVRGIQPY